MQPIIFTDTEYWEPSATNVNDRWVQETKPDVIIAHKDNLYADGASKRIGCPIIKYHGKNYQFGEKKISISPSYKQIEVRPLNIINNKPILCVDAPNELFASALGLASNNGFPVMCLGSKPWNIFFHIGTFAPDKLYDIISRSRAVLTADQDLMVNCWGLGIPSTNIIKPQELLDFVKNPKPIPQTKHRNDVLQQVLSLLK